MTAATSIRTSARTPLGRLVVILAPIALAATAPSVTLGAQAVDVPELLAVRELDAEAALGRGLELVPVVVQRAVDVDGDPHGR